MKAKIKKIIQFLLNPRLIFCLALAWMITNGWSYVMLGIGTYFGIVWMAVVASGYLAFLWLPISPEKIVTIALAILFLRMLFPNDTKTLAILKDMHRKLVDLLKRKREERRKKKDLKLSGAFLSECPKKNYWKAYPNPPELYKAI